jgi:hypothetical protein
MHINAAIMQERDSMADEAPPTHPRRAILQHMILAGLGSGLLADPALAQSPAPQIPAPPPFPLDFHGQGPIPWFTRAFHLYTAQDGKSRIESLPTNAPAMGEIALFLRRNAERVSIGGTGPNAGFSFHVANQPTLLIPILGTMMIGLEDGSFHELRHGDIAIAEDCSGKGHISRAGPQGSFMVSVQMPKALCPAIGSSDRNKLWFP